MEFKGWIALDIDGTITLDKYSVPKEVIAFLHGLYEKGWRIAFVTGRPFAFALLALSKFSFPYTFLAQNGSVALDMPEKTLLFKTYILPSVIPFVERAYEGIDSDFLVYAGYEKGDFCYWRRDRFSVEDLRYLADLQTRQHEEWQQVDNFKNLDPFPLIKCFGHESRLTKVATRLTAANLFEVAHIRDPFEEGYQILLVTDKQASKGKALSKVFKIKGRGQQVIAAGDDVNDLSLLEMADIKIAMAHAPDVLQKVATFIAPPTQDLGIITALQLALRDDD